MAGQVGWMPVALSADIAAGTANPAMVAGTEVVLWRTASGRLQAWVDRCPHRGMRFSFGFVRGEEIACLYHGWQFGAGGGCTRIPAHPDLQPPATIATDGYVAVEADGLVWLWPDRDTAPADEPPSLAGFAPVRSLTVLADPTAVIDALTGEAGASIADRVVTLPVGAWTLAVALQDKGGGETTLHVLATSATVLDHRALLEIAGWSEGLRRRLEAAPASAAA